MEFPGVLKKKHVEITRVNQKKSGNSGVIEKKLCGIFIMDVGFWHWHLQRVYHNSVEFPLKDLAVGGGGRGDAEILLNGQNPLSGVTKVIY